MTDTQHTPGPWVIHPEALGEHSIVTPDGRGLIADIYGRSPANARLIAAAPELLEALQDCVAVPNKNRPDEVWQRARAAIAKATGQ